MTRQEIIANHIATLRASVSDGLRNHAQSTFAHAIYAALATPGCEAQGVRLVDLPRLAERVAEMADAHEALRAERDELAATLTALALTDLSGPARHALATADQFGCLMPSYCGSPVADELRRYGLSKASMDPRWEGWEQLTDIGKAVRAAAGVKS